MRLTPPVGGFFRRTKQSLVIDGVVVPENRVVQVALLASNRHGTGDLETFRPQRHLEPRPPPPPRGSTPPCAARPPPPRRAYIPSGASRTLRGALETPNLIKKKLAHVSAGG